MFWPCFSLDRLGLVSLLGPSLLFSFTQSKHRKTNTAETLKYVEAEERVLFFLWKLKHGHAPFRATRRKIALARCSFSFLLPVEMWTEKSEREQAEPRWVRAVAEHEVSKSEAYPSSSHPLTHAM